MQKHNQLRQQPKLFEGLRPADLKGLVSHRFTIDQYKSKMGNDDTIVVLAFTVKDKFPAIDLMEFIEKGYTFVLDADMSTGEEAGGDYAVFVELQRTKKVSEEIDRLLKGISQLCDCYNWRFKYFKDVSSYDFTKEMFEKIVPLTPDEYTERSKAQKVTDVRAVLNKGPAEIADIDESNNITFKKPFTGNLVAALEAIGDYKTLSESLKGAIQLDQFSNGQTLFLEKYLGNYQIHKIDNRFLIRNGNDAIIIRKDRW